MLVSCGDRVHLYKLEGETWERQKGEGFDGIAATGPFRTIRDRTNFDPATMDGPEWFNIEPDDLIDTETVPDCVGDFNGDGTVDVGDLLELLGAWGTAHPYADIAPNGGDLTVDVQDMLALIAAWGACR